MRLLYAELLKIRTAPRTSLGLLLGLLALVGVASAATASEASGDARDEMAPWDLISVVSVTPIFTLIFGILIVTWEYRHGTITQTFLAIPRRERVIGAKLGVAFVVGAFLAALGVVLVLVVGELWIELDLQRGHWELAGRIVLGAALWGVFGAGLGALMQSQVGAIVTSFVWFLVAEPLFGFALDAAIDSSITEYLPGNALDRLQNQATVDVSEGGAEDVYPYSLWVAGLLAGAYAAALAALGLVSALRRDVP